MDKVLEEQVDVLVPPLFQPNGQVKPRGQAYADGDWVGIFNLWIVTRDPEPAIIYQQRGFDRVWAPGLLDVAAGGHFVAGEKLADGLREAEEELGRQYTADQITHLGRKLYVGFTADGLTRKQNVMEIYLIEDSAPLESYVVQASEIHALCICPVRELLLAHANPGYSFTAKGISAAGENLEIPVTKASFPENWDDYHYKMAILADRYFRGETNLIY